MYIGTYIHYVVVVTRIFPKKTSDMDALTIKHWP